MINVRFSAPFGVVGGPNLPFSDNISHFVHVPCIEHTFLYYGAIYASSLLSVKVVNLL